MMYYNIYIYMYNIIYICTIYTVALYLPVEKCTHLQYIV